MPGAAGSLGTIAVRIGRSSPWNGGGGGGYFGGGGAAVGDGGFYFYEDPPDDYMLADQLITAG